MVTLSVIYKAPGSSPWEPCAHSTQLKSHAYYNLPDNRPHPELFGFADTSGLVYRSPHNCIPSFLFHLIYTLVSSILDVQYYYTSII